MPEKEFIWTVKLDWLNILSLLNLRSIHQIAEVKREKAIAKLTKSFGTETLLDIEPAQLDQLVANELRDLMKKELSLYEKRRERLEKGMRSKVVPFKQGGIIKIDPRDFKDIDPNADPEKIMDILTKKLMGGEDDEEDNDDKDDKDKYHEDKTGYYI